MLLWQRWFRISFLPRSSSWMFDIESPDLILWFIFVSLGSLSLSVSWVWTTFTLIQLNLGTLEIGFFWRLPRNCVWEVETRIWILTKREKKIRIWMAFVGLYIWADFCWPAKKGSAQLICIFILGLWASSKPNGPSWM